MPEVVAVRWRCRRCDATAVGAPERLPSGWVEYPAPPWRVQHGPFFACPEHAEEELRVSANNWARYDARVYSVAASDFEQVRGLLSATAHEFERLKFSGQRAGDRDL